MPSRVANVVPTAATRKVARAMMRDAKMTTGGDSALRHLADLEPEQLTALVGLLLTQIKVISKVGRPPLPLTLTDDERRAGYAAYRRGEHTPFTEQAYREYQRVNQRARRLRRGLRAVG